MNARKLGYKTVTGVDMFIYQAQKAFEIWKPLADNGDARAQWFIGRLYYEGNHVEKNYKTAYAWFYLSQLCGYDSTEPIKYLEKDGWFSSPKVSKTEAELAKIEAQKMLENLSNKTHFVATSHTFIDTKTNSEKTILSKTYVTFRKLNNFEIIYYILTKNPLDKAGSYGIQDFISKDEINSEKKSSFISKIDGSYDNVVGFDIDLVIEMLDKFQCL